MPVSYMPIGSVSSSAFARHRIKFLTFVTLGLLMWVIVRFEGHTEISEHIKNMSVPSVSVPESLKSAGAKASETASKIFHGHGGSDDTAREVLSESAAAQFCTWYRLEPLDREAARRRKIFDLMLANTELDMLELRMGQQSHGVDYFVILESDKTFSGHDKPLYVLENMDRFKKWHPKMIRRTMNLSSDEFNGAWAKEEASRNSMYTQIVPYLDGDQAASPNDVILASDIDELFKPATLRIMRNCAVPDTMTVVSHTYYYGFQWKAPEPWYQPRAMIYHGADKQEMLPHKLRSHNTDITFEDGGWHCSYCFRTLKELVSKITSFSHTEYDQPQYKDPARTVFKVRNGWDVFERFNFTRMMGVLDLPDYVRANQKLYRHLLDRDPANANFADWDAAKGELIE